MGMDRYGLCGWVVSSLPPLWIADQVRNDVKMLVCLVSPSPLIPLPSRRPLKNCLFQDFDGFQGHFSASEGLKSVWNHLPDASFRRRSPVSEAVG